MHERWKVWRKEFERCGAKNLSVRSSSFSQVLVLLFITEKIPFHEKNIAETFRLQATSRCYNPRQLWERVTACLAPAGRNEVRWRPGQETNFAPPYSKLRSFGSKCTVLKNVLATSLELSGAPAVIWCTHIDSAPGVLRPPHPPMLRLCFYRFHFKHLHFTKCLWEQTFETK